MKKVTTTLLTLAIVLTMLPIGTLLVSAKTSGDFTYSVKNGQTTITGYSGNSSIVRIPAKIGSYPVTKIGSCAFFQNGRITSVSIPNIVKTIESDAFYGLSNLKSLTIPSSVITIEENAFLNCDTLTAITVPKNVKMIGDGAFSCCDNLKAIYVEKGNTYFCSVDGVLFNKSKTKLIQCPGKKTGTYTIPKSVKTIGKSAFEQCRHLTKITMSNNVTTIGKSAFWYCSNLISITLSRKLKELPEEALGCCYKLPSVTIPKGITSIGCGAFENCESIKSITIPKGVTYIGPMAFRYCWELTKITIPKSVKTIDFVAFGNCPIKTVHYDGSENDWRKIQGSTYAWSLDGGGTQATFHFKNVAEIITQPETTYTEYGQKAKATAKARGDGLTYTWYVKNAGSDKYVKSVIKKATYAAKMTDKVKNRRIYCVIRDKYGNKVKTDTVVLRMTATIVTQPKSVAVAAGDIAKTIVKAKGDGLKYTWYIKDQDDWDYKKSSIHKSTYAVKMSDQVKNRRLYCVITDKYNNVVQTKTVRLKMK